MKKFVLSAFSVMTFVSVTGLTYGAGVAQGAETAGGSVTETTDASFKQDVHDAKEPVLVDFYATWCGPCKALSPLIDKLAEKYQGRVKFVRVDVDKNPHISQKYSIKAMPTLKIFKDGKVSDSSVGYMPKDELESFVAKAVGNSQSK